MRIGIFVRAVVVVLSFFVLAMLVLGGICLVFGRSVLPYDLYSFLPLLLVTVAAALAIRSMRFANGDVCAGANACAGLPGSCTLEPVSLHY